MAVARFYGWNEDKAEQVGCDGDDGRGLNIQELLRSEKMANAVASYDQLAHQVEVLRKENSHLRRELEDNSNHLSKLETETFGMKEVLKQLQSKLEQEAGTLASSGRSDCAASTERFDSDLLPNRKNFGSSVEDFVLMRPGH
ncbi:Adenomatous polyposis coli protein 2 [Oryzias melastigma]|uniref:Adenomatous polyposis coli protein 2 n=1 Tax=Oryzias melastigma TaxID=30732 RepID=A0A834C8R6_ORYME|nr:Adenomatous polyposis coli protein 2 [Oryzias melastigma]